MLRFCDVGDVGNDGIVRLKDMGVGWGVHERVSWLRGCVLL